MLKYMCKNPIKTLKEELMKKKITIVFRTDGNTEAVLSIRDTISSVFSDYADIDMIFLNQLEPDAKVDSDIFLINNLSYLRELIDHAGKFDNISIITRSIDRKYLDTLNEIPEGSDVLVVNDELESSRQTVDMLMWLGFTSFNMVPYDPDAGGGQEYPGVCYAITPEEVPLVPAGIPNIINIGYRKIGFNTIYHLKQALGIDDDDINLKLFRYASSIAEPVNDSEYTYAGSYLKSRMLNDYISDAAAAMVLFNHRGQLVYSNIKAESVFPSLRDTKTQTLRELSPQLADISDSANGDDQIISLGDKAYLVSKKQIMLENIEVGCMYSIVDEADIKKQEQTLNKRLVEKGLFAKYRFKDIIGESPSLRNCISLAKKAAKTDYTILIKGESGVGKELFAQAIHNYSHRNAQPFVGVNCAAIPENLLESELFGYEGGAFTGANKNGKLGYFERANHGTIFLDEIGDVSAGLQSKLLRVIQERQIMRVGSDRVIDIDVRIIAATNKDLYKEVADGKFRNDLYYRLNVLQIRVPPLRERPDDIPELFRTFMGSDYLGIGNDTMDKLKAYGWPGNIRELENCVLYYKTLGELPEHFNVGLHGSCEDTSGTGVPPADIGHTIGTPLPPAGSPASEEIRSDQDLDERIRKSILLLLGRGNALGHGLGRTVILSQLKSMGFVISDGQLRAILSRLADEGLLLIGKGRQGTKITNLGIRKQKEVDS